MKPRISLWIVTYNNSEDLNNNLRSLFGAVGLHAVELEVNVINNHSVFHVDFEFLGKIKIYHNSLRSDSSTGHLARNWNQALILGFGNLNQPRCDMVICCQDDVIWESNWVSTLLSARASYNFITQGHGDAVTVHTVDSVKSIGLWDERFSPSFYHEGDYFLRAVIYNGAGSSINDPGHGRVWNSLNSNFVQVPPPNSLRQEAKNLSLGRAHLPFVFWQHKWPVDPINWSEQMLQQPPRQSLCVNYVTYPYFECDVEQLREKNYLV